MLPRRADEVGYVTRAGHRGPVHGAGQNALGAVFKHLIAHGSPLPQQFDQGEILGDGGADIPSA